MAEISAAAVKALREKTQLPMMECKRALSETGGDQDAAIELLRKQGKKTMESRSGRETAFGRLATYADVKAGVGAMIELCCESATVASHEEFIQLAKDLATQLATGPGAATPEELLKQPSPSQPDKTLDVQKEDLFNRMREVFKFTRIARIDAPCGGYAHHTGSPGVLVEVTGDDQQVANEIAMHVAAMRPAVVNREDLDPALVEKEREILMEVSRKEGKPENILEKMVEGRMRNFYAERVLTEQVFVKDEKGKNPVGKIAQAAGMKIVRFIYWELGKEA